MNAVRIGLINQYPDLILTYSSGLYTLHDFKQDIVYYSINHSELQNVLKNYKYIEPLLVSHAEDTGMSFQ